ncbi:MAG: hypothetical protein MUC43_05365 [Pirellula sp.]|jgi:hypothetical protein|nr:hypothetical protein [Pirellula sp.]
MLTSAPAFKCKVGRPDAWGWIKLGIRRHLIEVVEVSRDSFTARLPLSLARKIKIGKEFRLYYQGMLWAVQAKQKWPHEGEGVEVEFEQISELIAPKVKKVARQKSQMTSAGNSSDFTLISTIIAVVVLAALLMPSWGGKWGTSQVISDSVNAVYKALTSLVTGRS